MTKRVRAPIRKVQTGDAAEIARLAGKLDYPMPASKMGQRLADLLPVERHYIAVVASDTFAMTGAAHRAIALIVSNME